MLINLLQNLMTTGELPYMTDGNIAVKAYSDKNS